MLPECAANQATFVEQMRRIAGLTIEPDYVRGGAHTGRARFDNLAEFVATIGLAKGLGVQMKERAK